MQRHLYIVQNRHVIEQTDVLEGTGHAGLADQVRALAGDILAVQDDIAFGGGIHTGEHVEYGGLTGAVGADQTVQMTFLDFQVKLCNRLQAAEGNAQVAYFQQCHHCTSLALVPGFIRLRMPSTTRLRQATT